MVENKSLIIEEIYKAAKIAFKELFSRHKETFYYIALVTNGSGSTPCVSACSKEDVDRIITHPPYSKSDFENIEWSLADSSYWSFKQDAFQKVDKLFNNRPRCGELSVADWENELDFRLSCMEKAMQQLDLEGLFGIGQRREETIVNVEVIPPDHGNTLRVKRLNKPCNFLEKWINEMGE